MRLVAVLLLLLCQSPQAKKVQAGDYIPNSKPVRGVAIHFCSCSVPCPCMFTDNMANCDLVQVFHFVDGGYIDDFDKTHMKDTTAIVVAPSSGKLAELRKRPGSPPKSTVALYLDKKLTPAQESAVKFALVEHIGALGWQDFTTRKVDLKFRQFTAPR